VFIKDPPENSMATFNFTSAVLPEGTTFIFSLSIYVADGVGGFRRHLIDNAKLEALAATQHSDLDESSTISMRCYSLT
jgi:hypothetical protein